MSVNILNFLGPVDAEILDNQQRYLLCQEVFLVFRVSLVC